MTIADKLIRMIRASKTPRRLDYRYCEECGGPVVDYSLHDQGITALFRTIPRLEKRISDLEEQYALLLSSKEGGQ